MYRTISYRIKKHSKLYTYCQQMCFFSARLYNRVYYIVRQYASAMERYRTCTPLSQNQMDVVRLVDRYLSGTKYEPDGDWLSYVSVDYLLKVTHDDAYYAMPSQSNQQVIKKVMADIKGFFQSVKAYKKDPSSFTGFPKLPHYKKKYTSVYLTNQICKIVQDRFVRFPKTQALLKLKASDQGVLKECRIVHRSDLCVEVVMEYGDVTLPSSGTDSFTTLPKCMGIDLGIDNLCSVVVPGKESFLIKGGVLKSVNHYYNQKLSELKSVSVSRNGVKTTRRIRRLTERRNRKIKDIMHKISSYLADYAERNGLQYVVVGYNRFQKQEICIGKQNNQNFVQIPFLKLISMLEYKLQERGIRLITVEESYTSKADYKALDVMPVYGKEEDTPIFSGKRIRRGLYRHFDGNIGNADTNGAANILRKAFPNVTDGWDTGCVEHPYIVRISY